jgi:hypothetical protein
MMILLSEELEEQQQLIKQLGREIALIKNRDQLANLIGFSLKKMVGYQYSTIFVLADDGTEITNFLKECGDTASRNQFSERILTGKIPFDYKMNNLLVQDHHQIIDFDEVVLSENSEPYLTSAGIAEIFDVCVFHLHQGNAIIGVWIILLNKQNDKQFELSTLCNQIASQLTFAILTIKAQDE